MDVDSDNVFPRTKVGRDHQMRDMYRHGKVIDRKHDAKRGPLVRVQYLDRQGLISQWLPIKQFGSRSTMHYYCPKIGDDVNVNMPPNGNENGFVDGSFFNESNPPPEVDLNTRHYKTEDGTVVEYREIDSTFNLKGVGPVLVEGTLIEITATESHVKIHAATLIEGQAPAIEFTADTHVMITAPEITLTGHMTFNGLISHQGDMNTTGVHTDANGIHGGMRREELEERVRLLEERVQALEART